MSNVYPIERWRSFDSDIPIARNYENRDMRVDAQQTETIVFFFAYYSITAVRLLIRNSYLFILF